MMLQSKQKEPHSNKLLCIYYEVMRLIGSMNFAISLFILICLISIIGTLIEQNHAVDFYIDRIGFFWFDIFKKLGIYSIFSSSYFLFTIIVLILSVSICLIRNSPRILRDVYSFNMHVKPINFHAFPHLIETRSRCELGLLNIKLKDFLKNLGFSFRERETNEGLLFVAKKGHLNRLGYVLSHFSVVIICLGGFLDSQILLRLQVLLDKKKPILQEMFISEIPESGKLNINNLSYRSLVFVPENGKISSGIIRFGSGIFIQPLPFELELKKFITNYYPNGTPKQFSSLVEVTDLKKGSKFDSKIEVNKPICINGIKIYQSGFGDAGTQVILNSYQLGTVKPAFKTQGKIGENLTHLYVNPDGFSRKVFIELKDFHINTAIRGSILSQENGNVGKNYQGSGTYYLSMLMGNAGPKKNEDFKHLGPVLNYKLKNYLGEVYEFNSYMLPYLEEAQNVLLISLRKDSWDSTHFLRIPVDKYGNFEKFIAIRNKLLDPITRKFEIDCFIENMQIGETLNRMILKNMMNNILKILVYDGFQSVLDFLEKNIDSNQVESSKTMTMQLIGSILCQLYENTDIYAGDDTTKNDAEISSSWIHLATMAISDLAKLDQSLILFSLENFEHRQASIFQINRIFGERFVYIGFALMITGIFLMFYIRNIRIWLFIKSDNNGGNIVYMAMNEGKHDRCFNEFERFKKALFEKIQ